MKVLSAILVASTLVLSGCFHNDDDDDDTPPMFTASATFNVMLSGKQQVPANDSSQSAEGMVEVDETLMLMRASVDLSGIEGVTAVHIHNGDIGRNGDVAFTLSAGANGAYTLAETAVTDALIADLKDGDWYINVHTDAYPDGEIRGQIVDDNTVIVTFGLTPEQEVPGVDSDASGYGYATVDTSDYALDLVVHTQGADDATAAHIHTGRIGMNGGVLAALEQDTEAGVWTSPAGLMLDADIFAVLASGGHYVNVHTPANPGGELRGQILTDNFALVTFNLSGAQEVPAARTDASGDGYALVNTDDYALELVVVTDGVDDATAAHIHTGRIGMNGGVLLALEQGIDMPHVWMAPEGSMIDADTFATLAGGGHYVNVHTPAYPGGEIRGQILTHNYVMATFALSGMQEVPAVSTMASGSGYALLNMDDYALEVKVVTEGVDDATGAHIHTGRIGMNGEVLVALEQSMDDLGTWMTPEDTSINADIFAVLANAGHYVNVHTPAHPGGELRGQILPEDFAMATFSLSGEQEVPAVATEAMGDGYALVNMETYALELIIHTQGVDNATGAHIHTGNIGMNGGVLVALEQSMDEMGTWMTPEGTMITEEILELMGEGGHYVNVHTPAHPGGEIRGQITPDNYLLYTFPLTGAQQVPAVITTASGDGYALLNKDSMALTLTVLTSGVADATMAHIHEGEAGANGDVVVSLEQDMADMNRWSTPAGTELSDAIFALFIAGGHYVNVHTPAFPGGELRGQIE